MQKTVDEHEVVVLWGVESEGGGSLWHWQCGNLELTRSG